MDKDSFVRFCKRQNYQDIACTRFTEAIDFIAPLLKKKPRLAGDSFYDHNIRVSQILMRNKVAPEIVLAGILHGLLGIADDKIKENFGEDIFSLVQGVAEIKKIKSKNRHLQVEGLRKIFFTTLKDVRVIFVKLANKLDNLRTISPLPELERERIAQEVLEIYAPLAYRLGMEKMRVQLEDIAFKILQPKKYQQIAQFLESSKEERDLAVAKAKEKIEHLVNEKADILRIKGRSKHIYSIYKKIKSRSKKLQELHDLLGLRIIVADVKDCYTLLGLLHENFEPVEGRLKDYVTNPKPNFYRSIHTGVLIDGKLAEIQIRTEEMDEFAEEGLAAHWRYKGVKSDIFFEKKIGWLRNILELQKEGKDKEFLEAAKIDVFGDKIYCYTPKGDLKELPKKSSLLDFAFLIHEEVGSKAVGGRINGKFVSLKATLEMGDVVEVITNKNQRPRRSWLKIVRSARARQKIRKSLKVHEKLAPLFYRRLKPDVKDQKGVLVSSEAFPKAVCVLAKCCQPLPGKQIVGVLTKRRVISVHQEECRLADKLKERWISVAWREQFNQKITFIVLAKERSGLLADVLHTIASAGFEVSEAKAKLIDLGNVSCSFMVVPRNLEELKKLVTRVKKVKGVQKIYFE